MSHKRHRRRWILIAGVLGMLLVTTALPLWFPWTLRPVANRLGLRYERYERVGYQRFRLIGLSLTQGAGRFQAERVEAFVPTTWLWRRFFGPKFAPFLLVDSWSWHSTPSEPGQGAVSLPAHARKVEAAIARLGAWIPQAVLTNGSVRVAGQTLEIPAARWSNGTLSARLVLPRFATAFTLRAGAGPQGTLGFKLDSAPLRIRSSFSISPTAGGLQLDGTAYWLSNRIEAQALFPQSGLLPETASVRADSFKIPARLFQLEPYYRYLTGSLRADWKTNRFAVNLAARALAREPGRYPPLELEARASGDTNSARIDSAGISASWLNARLTRSARVGFKPPFLLQPATLNVRADLNEQSWLKVRGQLGGEAILRPDGGPYPTVDFKLRGTNIALAHVAATELRLDGRLLWPRLELAQADLELPDNSSLSLKGSCNLRTKKVQAGHLDYSGSYVQRWLPSGFSLQSASLAAQFAGPLNQLTNSATVTVNHLVAPHSAPLQLAAEWKGRGLNLHRAEIALAAGASSLHLSGSAELGGVGKKFNVTSLRLSRSNHVELKLQKPFALIVQRRTHSWSFQLQPALCSGKDRNLELEAGLNWPEQGRVRITAAGLPATMAADFLRGPLPDARLDRLAFAGGWTNGPLHFDLNLRAGATTQERFPFAADAEMRGGADGIAIERLSVSSATQTVFQAQGTLPIVLNPVQRPDWARILTNAPLDLRLQTAPHSVLWSKLADATGASLQEPRFEAELGGTWAAPKGRATLRAKAVQFPRIKRPLPKLQDVDAVAEFDQESARIKRLDVQVAGQPLTFTARFPLGKSYWLNLARHRRLPDWRRATAHLKMDHAQLAPLADVLPGILAPQGTGDVNLALAPGALLQGTVSLHDAATRPLSNIGPIRHVRGTVVFAGKTAQLTNFSAEIGGQQITADGRMDLREALESGRGLPPFQVDLHGTNVPLIRKPGLVLRANLDLAVTNQVPKPPVISGTVKLRNSLFLADLRTLVPEHAAAPKQRPPYFSVDASPWKSWALRLNVQGDQFMRVQTPLFRGTVSAALKLRGTLGTPLALGEVRIRSGAVTFPFGSLEVNQGFITLTSDNPYHPQLYLSASTEQFGYNVKMEVTGAADQPVVQFSSTPPLSSEQVVMMLTTGQVPAGVGYSNTLQQRAQGVALFLGRNLLTEFGVGSGSQNRLTIRSGQQISETGRPTYNVEYKLSKRWSIVGEYDRFDQYDLNLKWRVYSK